MAKSPGNVVGNSLIKGRREPRKIIKAIEPVSEYHLEDGTVLLVKLSLLGVSRVMGKFNVKSDPVYEVTGGMILDSKVPKRLKRR